MKLLNDPEPEVREKAITQLSLVIRPPMHPSFKTTILPCIDTLSKDKHEYVRVALA